MAIRYISVTLATLFLVGCGRYGFDPSANVVDDGSPDASIALRAGPFSLDYGRTWAVLASNQPMASLEPTVLGFGATYTVVPTLPAGLMLDASSGVISGTPLATQSAVDYILTLAGETGTTVDFSLSIEVREAIAVDSSLDLEDTSDDGVCDADINDGLPGTPCTLRAAVQTAGSYPADSRVITVPAGNYLLESTLRVNTDVAIVGGGRSTSVLDGDDARRVMLVSTAVHLRVSDLGFVHGEAETGGGLKVYRGANVHLSNVEFRDNKATTGGGAIAVHEDDGPASLWLEYAGIFNNRAERGAGLESVGGPVDVFRTVIEGNAAIGSGGGVFAANQNITTSIRSSYIASNTAGTTGGGVMASNGAEIVVINTSLDSNRATQEGGAVATRDASVNLSHCTISSNVGMTGHDALHAILNGAIVSTNTIYAAGDGSDLCGAFTAGTIQSGGGNLVSTDDIDCAFSDPSDGIADPMLSTAPDRSGVVPVFRVASDSPAIDSIAVSQCGSEDFRGVRRPIDGDANGEARCDSGAIEMLSE